MCVMHPIIITFWDPWLCTDQLAPNATFTPSQLLAPGSWLLMSPLFITWPAITNFPMLGSIEPSFFQQPNFISFVHATRNASPYFFYLTCELSSPYARYLLVYAYCLCPVLVTAFSCCATQTVFSLWHRFLWRCHGGGDSAGPRTPTTPAPPPPPPRGLRPTNRCQRCRPQASMGA